MTVKVEPVASESQNASQNDEEDRTSGNLGTFEEFEPQPGPSGLNVHRAEANHRSNLPSDDDDYDTDDEHDIGRRKSIWRPVQPLREIPSPSLADNNAVSNPNDFSGSGFPMANCTNDLLTAPDLQLDWMSDSSNQTNDDDVVYVPSAPMAEVKVEVGVEDIPHRAPQIDLTGESDDDVMEVEVSPDHFNVDRGRRVHRQNAILSSLLDMRPYPPCSCLQSFNENSQTPPLAVPTEANDQQQSSSSRHSPPLRSALYRESDTSFNRQSPEPIWYNDQPNQEQSTSSQTQPQQVSSGRRVCLPQLSPSESTLNWAAPAYVPRSASTVGNPVDLSPTNQHESPPSPTAPAQDPVQSHRSFGRSRTENRRSPSRTWSFGSNAGHRCPFLSTDRNRRYVNNNFNPHLQQHTNGSYWHRPGGYAPHENLWHRQQNTQELHRRHMMHPSEPINYSNTSRNIGGQASNSVYCLSCDQQHPHPVSIRRRAYDYNTTGVI